jgi:hypothetical protein
MNYGFKPFYRSNNRFILRPLDEVFREYPLNSMYLISNYGEVYCKRGYLVSKFINRNGYVECKLDEHNELIHRLVAITFIPVENYEVLDVNHKDGNKQNNYVLNLEWTTRSMNIQHAFDNGLSKLGEDHPNSIYSNQEIETICKLLEEGTYNSKQIANAIGREYNKRFINLIYKIRHKKLWKHISDKYKI